MLSFGELIDCSVAEILVATTETPLDDAVVAKIEAELAIVTATPLDYLIYDRYRI